MADKKFTRNVWVADNTCSIIYRHNTLFHSISFHTTSWWNLTSQLSHKLLGTFTSYIPFLYTIIEFLKAETIYLSSPILPVSKSSNACQFQNHHMPWFTQTVRTAHLQGYGIVLITAFYYYLNSHDRKCNQEGQEFKAQPFFTQEAQVSDCLNIYFCIKKTFKLSLISSHTTSRQTENSRFLGKAALGGLYWGRIPGFPKLLWKRWGEARWKEREGKYSVVMDLSLTLC